MILKQYRPEIDGLRAIAVLGVIAFHAGMRLPGGYTGVDIFFVISGYLITSIINREYEDKSFSLTQFWVRRIRRILPAACFVVLTTFVVGSFILDPGPFRELGKSGAAHVLMLANVFFWQSINYFSESAELQPLLHMWSLSVEEQFYIFFPILMVFLLPQKKRIMITILVIITLLSFMVNIFGVNKFPAATFYLLPTRAWELASGALVALSENRIRFSKQVNNVVGLLGLCAIFCSMFFINESTSFPGWAAVLPVGGTVAIIATNSSRQTLVGRVLSLKPFVAIGLISYSLYLWHWPILVFYRHIIIEDTMFRTFVFLLLTFIFSYFSWKIIEVPFRRSLVLGHAKAAFTFGGLVSFSIVFIAFIIYFNNGFPSRLDPKIAELEEDIFWNGAEYVSNDSFGVPIGVTGHDSERVNFILWGDSHGMALGKLIDSVAKYQKLKGIALLSSGKPPITGLWKPMKGSNREEVTLALNRSRMDRITQSGVKDVILIARWTGMIEGLLPTEIDVRNGRAYNYNMVVDKIGVKPTKEISQDAFFRQFKKMKSEFASQGIRVWVLLQVPSATRSEVARDYFISRRYPLFNSGIIQFDTSRDEYDGYRDRILNIFQQLESDEFIIVDPVDVFYKSNNRLKLFSDSAFYRDEDHLTRSGAEHYLLPTFSHILSQIGEEPRIGSEKSATMKYNIEWNQ